MIKKNAISICFFFFSCILLYPQKTKLDRRKIIKSEDRYEIKQIERINTKYTESYPAFFYDDILVYCSMEPNNKVSKKIYGNTDLIGFEIYQYDFKKPNKKPEPFFVLDDQDGVKGFIVGGIRSPSFNYDKTIMYYSKNICTENLKKRRVDCNFKLYKAKTKLGKQEYNVIDEPLNFNLKGKNYNYPVLSSDEDYLYFVSDGYNKPGNLELMVVSVKRNTDFGKIEKVKGVERYGNKISSLFIKDSIIYFSNNLDGDLDVFKGVFKNYKRIVDVKKIEIPVNMQGSNEYGFCFKDNETDAVFVSDRNVGKDFDIFTVKKQPEIVVEAEIVDVISKRPIDEVKVLIFDMDDALIRELNVDNGYFGIELPFGLNYKIVAVKPGYFDTEETALSKYISDSQLTYSMNIGMNPREITLKGNISTVPVDDLSGTNVVVYDANENLLSTGITDYKGSFEIQVPTMNQYFLEISKLNFTPFREILTLDEIKRTKNDFRKVLIKNQLRGFVSDKNNRPISSAIVSVYSRSNALIGTTSTDPFGNYVITVPTFPSYVINVAKSGYNASKITLTSEVLSSYKNVHNVKLVNTVDSKYKGVVYGKKNKKAISNAVVLVYDLLDNHLISTTYTNEDGEYVVNYVGSNGIKLRISSKGYITEEIKIESLLSDSQLSRDVYLEKK